MTRLTSGVAFLTLAVSAWSPAFAQEQPEVQAQAPAPAVSLTEQLYSNPGAALAATAHAPEPSAPAAEPEDSAIPAAKTVAAAKLVPGSGRAELDALIARHAAQHGVPLDLAHRVVIRESRYNPRAVSRGNYGLMQIRLATARGLGYRGDASGLLDPETNLTYAMKYLAGAYKAAGGNSSRAVSYYASGYYYVAKRQRLTRSADAAQ